MKLNDICPHLFVINLDKRADRLEQFCSEAKKYNFTFTRVAGIDGNTINNTTCLRSGELGLLFGYAALIQHAINEKLPSILVMEDDVVFEPDFQERLEKEWPEIPQDFDMVYLGFTRGLGSNAIPFEPISKNIVRLKSAYGLHAHFIKNTIYHDILSLIETLSAPLDVLYCQIQQKYRVFGFSRNLAKQRDGYSDILGFDPEYNKQKIFG